MRRLRVVLPLLALAACSPLRGCVESQFSLAPDSRLPQWFAAPVVKDRSDVAVKLTYWTNGDADESSHMDLAGLKRGYGGVAF